MYEMYQMSLKRWLIVVVTCVAACSSPKPKPKAAPTNSESKHKMVNPLDDSDDIQDGLQVEGVLGSLEQSAIQAGLDPKLTTVNACFTQHLRLAPYLGGKATLTFRVATNGTIKKLNFTDSDLGSSAIERCILQTLGQVTFERPKGGEAEFTYPLIFNGRVQAQVWDPGMIRDEIEQHMDELIEAKGENGEVTVMDVPNNLTVTFYVDHRGKVVSAGMIAEDPVEEFFAEQLTQNLKKIKFVEPQGGYAKVTFSW